jgi:hypothetical protein
LGRRLVGSLVDIVLLRLLVVVVRSSSFNRSAAVSSITVMCAAS